MIQQSFTAQELFCMARLAGKKRLFGIPDGFSGIDEEDRPAAIRMITDSLLEQQVAEMSIDGKTSLKQEYLEIIEICCSCSKCLTITRQSSDGVSDAFIFWKYNGSIYEAVIQGTRYSIVPCDEFTVRAICEKKFPQPSSIDAMEEATVPQNSLIRAKKLAAKGDEEGCMRLLRQSGADQRMVRILTDGMLEKADYLALLLMDNTGAEVTALDTNRLQSQGITLTTKSTVVNYRTCIVFVPVSQEEMRGREETMVSQFIQD